MDCLLWDQFEYVVDAYLSQDESELKGWTLEFDMSVPRTKVPLDYLVEDKHNHRIKFKVIYFQQFYEKCANQVSDKVHPDQIAKKNKSSYFIQALKTEKAPYQDYKAKTSQYAKKRSEVDDLSTVGAAKLAG